MTWNFVAREAELQQLDGFLHQALAGEPQLCFIAGEAGTGKSTLIREFVKRSQEQHENLICAYAGCNDKTGFSDFYLPFRQILNILTGDEARIAKDVK
jgi:predicted ATPase